MDYKYLTTDMRYDDFGNFNYGAVGMAIEFTLGTLLRVAGWVQQQGKNTYLGRGTAPSNKVKAFLGVGGESPFGDKPGDQIQIANGIKAQAESSAASLRIPEVFLLTSFELRVLAKKFENNY